MMRAVWCLFLVTLATANAGNAKVEIIILPPVRASGIVEASSKCIEELSLEKDTMEKFFAWELSDSESSRKYVYCLGTESGYMANDGSINKDEVLEVVGSHRDRIGGVIDECNKLKYNDKYEAVFHNVNCFNQKCRLHFSV